TRPKSTRSKNFGGSPVPYSRFTESDDVEALAVGPFARLGFARNVEVSSSPERAAGRPVGSPGGFGFRGGRGSPGSRLIGDGSPQRVPRLSEIGVFIILETTGTCN